MDAGGFIYQPHQRHRAGQRAAPRKMVDRAQPVVSINRSGKPEDKERWWKEIEIQLFDVLKNYFESE